MPTKPTPACLVSTCPARRPCPAHDAGVAHRPASWGWYHLAKWRHPVWGIRAVVLREQPLCLPCQTEGRIEPSTEVDHIRPHKGDRAMFFNRANCQGLCHRHHNEKTGRGE
jgi:5-methylcytosine-specific restriction protein A